LALFTVTEDFDQDPLRLKLAPPANLFYILDKEPILKFDDFPAFQADQMIVMFPLMNMLVVMVFLSIDHFFDKTCLHQKRQRAINGCLRDPVSLPSEAIGEFFGLKMAIRSEDFLQNLLSLRCPLQPLLLFEIVKKLRFCFDEHKPLIVANENQSQINIYVIFLSREK
jgi:hypothetical protein